MSDETDKKFSCLFGLFLCVSCKRRLYENKDSVSFVKTNETLDNQEKENVNDQNEDNDKEEVESKKDQDYVYKSVDNENKRLKLAAAFQEAIMAPPAKKYTYLMLTTKFCASLLLEIVVFLILKITVGSVVLN